jgi:hypothetical protein
VCAPFFRGIEEIKWIKFAESRHMPHWEERESYMQVVESFLREIYAPRLLCIYPSVYSVHSRHRHRYACSKTSDVFAFILQIGLGPDCVPWKLLTASRCLFNHARL